MPENYRIYCPFCNNELDVPKKIEEIVSIDEEESFREIGLKPGDSYAVDFEIKTCPKCNSVYSFCPSFDTSERLEEILEYKMQRTAFEDVVTEKLFNTEIKTIPFNYETKRILKSLSLKQWEKRKGAGFLLFIKKPESFALVCDCGKTIGIFDNWAKEFYFKCSSCKKKYVLKSSQTLRLSESKALSLKKAKKVTKSLIKCPFCGTKLNLPSPVYITMPAKTEKEYEAFKDLHAQPGEKLIADYEIERCPTCFTYYTFSAPPLVDESETIEDMLEFIGYKDPYLQGKTLNQISYRVESIAFDMSEKKKVSRKVFDTAQQQGFEDSTVGKLVFLHLPPDSETERINCECGSMLCVAAKNGRYIKVRCSCGKIYVLQSEFFCGLSVA